MEKRFIKNRKVRYGGITVLLTVLLITVTVLFNAVFSTLAKRYAWYGDMTRTEEFRIGETCHTLLNSVLKNSTEPVKIIFCNTEKNILADSTAKYVYRSATQIAGLFPEQVEVLCYDIRLNPTLVKDYGNTFDVKTGATIPLNIATTNVIFVRGDYHRVYSLTEFFVFEGTSSSSVVGYNGEKKITAGILHAVEDGEKVVCLTNNHGEAYYDYELVMLLDDAGYRLSYVDLYSDEIPEDCRLVITFNPTADLKVKEDQAAEVSETEKLDAFLAKPGNAYLVFFGKSTIQLDNLENYLKTWGVETQYSTSSENENLKYRYMVQDTQNSLTSDGYTVYGEAATEGKAKELLGNVSDRVVFKNATALKTVNGFRQQEDGGYQKDNRVLYPLFVSEKSASAWAGGKAVDSGNMMLMSMTEQMNEGGSSYLGVVASVDFATQELLQSVVYRNPDLLLQVCKDFGMENVPLGLTYQPFDNSAISIVTTFEKWGWTLLLSLVPALGVTAVALAVLVRRRNA